MGDVALPGSQVRLSPQAKSVRVRTTTPVYEPLLTVKLVAGCAGAVSRTYTFFADPPRSMAASVEPIDLSKIQVSTLPAVAAVAATAAPRPAVEKKPRPAKRAVATKAESKPAAAAPAAASAASATADAQTTSASAAVAPQEAAPQASVNADKPRLKMEPIEGLDTPVTGSADSADASSTVPPSTLIDAHAQMLLDANAARLEAMEKQLQTLQTQLTHNRTEIASLHTQLVQAQNQELPIWVYVMLCLLALALATIAWLLQRIKHERASMQRTWADTVLAVDDTQVATTIDTTAKQPLHVAAAGGVQTVEKPVMAKDATPATPNVAAPDVSPTAEDAQESWLPDHQAHALFAELSRAPSMAAVPAPATATHTNASLAEVLTAQALFDVQEQAEFYASIGENDQAIEILQTHIAQHEASSPLAYIELLQLLYRLSRTEAFEQVREKFQKHFNVHVPDFMGFSRKGRDLWSGHPEVLGKIEALWPTDDVQPLLRSLIVRKPTVENAENDVRFDLSAFDDLLMLYNVAQTTPASSRGQLPGRVRTAPTEVPLPEVFIDESKAAAPTLRMREEHNAQAAPLPLNAAYLEVLTAAPAQAPLAPPQPLNDSPFKGTSHFTPDESLMDGLTLDWGTETPKEPPASALPSPQIDDLSVDDELAAFMMDERDLPAAPPSKK